MNRIRTRFAPSPTGYIHVGNLRTALYSYLIAKHAKDEGKFILRIEDTDQNRSDVKFESYIFKALKDLGICWDEGPDVGGLYGPYKQSERKTLYLSYALNLVESGNAYFCFCPECKSDTTEDQNKDSGYNGHCRNLTKEEVEKNLQEGKPFVIRQKIPKDQIVQYDDMVYGHIEFDTNELDDQVLIKRDGYPTYNFANVVDDHLMNITHIVRGNEYLSSTPKYVLLYKAFNWDIPNFIHLPIIHIKDEETGNTRKLSKRDGCSSFDNLLSEGYLPEAIINYIMFLGWNPKSDQEIFSLEQLIDIFDISQLNKNDIVLFNKAKLDWFNKQYISKLDFNTIKQYCIKYSNFPEDFCWDKVIPLIKDKIVKFSDVDKECSVIIQSDEYDSSLFYNYDKYLITDSLIKDLCDYLLKFENYETAQDYYSIMKRYSFHSKKIFGACMHIFRVLMSGRKNVMITGIDIANIIGFEEVKNRIEQGLEKIK